MWLKRVQGQLWSKPIQSPVRRGRLWGATPPRLEVYTVPRSIPVLRDNATGIGAWGGSVVEKAWEVVSLAHEIV